MTEKKTLKGSLTVVSGFSGAGKGTLMRELLKNHDCYALSVSMTTRAPREGEVNGREYFFVTQEEFDQTIQKNGFLEYAGYVNHSYGTPRRYVEEQIAAGKDVLLEIEVQGAMQILKAMPEANTVFVITPSAEELRRRLIGRGTETAESVAGRLARAVEESEYIPFYQHLLVNDNLEEAAERLHALIQESKEERAFVEQFRKELRSSIDQSRQ